MTETGEKSKKSGECKNPKSNKFVLLGLAAVLVGLHVAMKQHASTTPIASTKPFNTFDEFYPFYISQHSDVTCRRLHFIATCLVFAYSVLNPSVLLSFAMCILAGQTVFPLNRSISHGFIEMGVLMATFLVTMKLSTGCVKGALALLLVGYGMAWVGHFFFEHNKPATFIYPTYSLMGDFKLWYEIATQVREF